MANDVYMVRTGLFGQVDKMACSLPFRLVPGSRAICRTNRGLEVGNVLGPIEEAGDRSAYSSQILRPVNQQDELLIARLARFRNQAISNCEKLLHQKGIQATLLDAEQLFDGKHLFFYFWDLSDPSLDEIMTELAEKYDRSVGFSRFAKALADGCGPNCGMSLCGSSATPCSNCDASQCRTRQTSNRVRSSNAEFDQTPKAT